MTLTSFRTVAAVSTLALCSALAACSGGGEPSDPHDRLAAVKDAISKPSGAVDATSMKNVSQLFASTQAAAPVLALLGSVNNGNAKSCTTGNGTSGSVDLSCATQGSATGSIDFTVEASASSGTTTATVIADLKNACSGNVCVTGNVIVEASVTNGVVKTSVAVSADVTQSGSKTHVFFGEEDQVADKTVATKVALFDSKGDSYVIEASVSPSGATYAIEGANGSFQCSMTPQGGQCSGSASFSF